MDRQSFIKATLDLRSQGKSIRAIATDLGVDRGRVDRALKASQSASSVRSNPDTSPFVGRAAEKAALTVALDRSFAGHGQVVMLAGEPGIGKTRTSLELAASARERGALVISGRCIETRGAPPYWPWIQAIRTYVAVTPPDRLQSEMGSVAPDIAQIVPELSERIPDLHTAPIPDDPEHARFRLFDSITAALKNISFTQQLVVVIDDLHWADRSSLLLLEFLAREMADVRLLVLGTYRDSEIPNGHELSTTLGEIAREPLFQQLHLDGLRESDVQSFMQSASRFEPTVELVEAVYSRTEGNPFFMTEVVRLLDLEDETSPPPVSGLPDSVRLAIGRRMTRLSPETQQVLTVASVLGREFELGQLEHLRESKDGDGIPGAVDEAISAHMIEEIPGTAGRYQFAHVLIQDSLVREFSGVRRTELHARIGDVLEESYGSNAEAHSGELAYHFLRGNVPEKAAEYALKAGDRASAVYAWEQAIGQYETAVELLERLEANPRQQAEILERLAYAAGTSTGKDFLPPLQKALSHYEVLGDQVKAGAVHLQISRLIMGSTGDFVTSGAYASKAVTLLESEGESALLARAYVEAGQNAVHLGGPVSGAIPMIEKGLALAEQFGDVAAAAMATRLLGHALVYHAGEIGRGLELHDDGWEMAREGYNADDSVSAASVLHLSNLVVRDSRSAIRWAEESVKTADVLGSANDKVRTSLALAQASILGGDVPRALQGLEMAHDAARKSGSEVGQVMNVVGVAQGQVQFHLGDWNEARTELLRWLKAGNQTRAIHVTQAASCALGELCLEEGDLAGANRHLLEAATLSEARGERTLEIVPRALLARVASRTGEPAEARTHFGRAREIVSNGENWRGLAAEVCLTDGILASNEERWSEAETAFRETVNINHRYGLPYYEAQSLTEWAQMLMSRNRSGDDAEAAAHLDSALGIFQTIQASKMVEKVIALQERLERDTARVHGYPDGLTQREVEVLQLIAAGRSNREIAGELFLSVRTIERHITNIYRKIDAGGRADATVYALRHDLPRLSATDANDDTVKA